MIGSFVFAQQYGLIIADNVNVRDESSSKSKIVGKIPNAMTYVVVDDNSFNDESIEVGITTMTYPWYQINQDDKLKGWVYGAYIIILNSGDSILECISQNIDFRILHAGKYNYTDHTEYFETYYELELLFDGKVNISSNSVQGDHILEEKGEGRYYINTRTATLNIYGNMTGEFAPDFYSWEEYFAMDQGHKPTQKELDAYIKEKSHYKSRCSFSIPLDKLNELLIPSKY
jgi:hypothetical protein